jgi:hypothetical protein
VKPAARANGSLGTWANCFACKVRFRHDPDVPQYLRRAPSRPCARGTAALEGGHDQRFAGPATISPCGGAARDIRGSLSRPGLSAWPSALPLRRADPSFQVTALRRAVDCGEKGTSSPRRRCTASAFVHTASCIAGACSEGSTGPSSACRVTRVSYLVESAAVRETRCAARRSGFFTSAIGGAWRKSGRGDRAEPAARRKFAAVTGRGGEQAARERASSESPATAANGWLREILPLTPASGGRPCAGRARCRRIPWSRACRVRA